MENTTSQIEVLLRRLAEAERRSKLLKLEVKSIRCEISTLQTSLAAQTASNFGTSTLFVEDVENLSVLDGSSAPKKPRLENEIGGNNFTYYKDYVIVYTDGACEHNGKPNARAGIGVWFGNNHPMNISQAVVGRATNNTAEIQACTEALTLLKSQGVDKAKIITDSQFTISCMTNWIKNWKKNNWRTAQGKPVINKEDLIKLDSIVQRFKDIQWQHVDGHSGHEGNEAADRLARQGAKRYTP